MDLKQLEYFVRVAEHGGFTKAAAALSITQPSLSKQIRQLEVELHRNLLVRNGRGVSLTEEGAMLLAHAKGLLEQAERVRHEITDLKGSPTGKVTMGASTAAGTAGIAGFVATFRDRFPRASLEIIQIKGSSIYEWLLQGRIDIGILYDPPPSPLIEITPLREDELFLVSPLSSRTLPRSSKVAVRQLGQYPLILPGAIRGLVERAAAKVGTKLNIPLQVDGGSFILQLVYQGQGYTILPRHMAEESNLARKLQINEIVKPRLTRTVTLAVSSQRRITHLTQETVKLIRHYLESDRPTRNRKLHF